MKRLAHTLLTALLLAGLLYLGARLHVSPTAIVSVAALISSLSLALSLSLQGVLQNFVAGRIVRAERRFSPGDTITCMGFTGAVLEVGWRLTSFRDANGDVVYLPNAQLFALPFVVHTVHPRPSTLADRLLRRLGLSSKE